MKPLLSPQGITAKQGSRDDFIVCTQANEVLDNDAAMEARAVAPGNLFGDPVDDVFAGEDPDRSAGTGHIVVPSSSTVAQTGDGEPGGAQ